MKRKYPLAFERYWDSCQINKDVCNFRVPVKYEALPEVKLACYRAWMAGRRFNSWSYSHQAEYAEDYAIRLERALNFNEEVSDE